jgi:hypothetical protein
MRYSPVVGTSGRVYGAGVIPRRSGAEKPIFVSVGNMIDLDTAVELVHETSLFRIPEAIRMADGGSRAVLRVMEEMMGENSGRESGKRRGEGTRAGESGVGRLGRIDE